MDKSRLKVNVYCGDMHSKHFKPNVLVPFLVSRNEDGLINKFNSDTHLLLRQLDVQKSIGYEAIRNYVDSLNSKSPESHNLSDDELLSLLPPDGVDTITDVYQYSKFLQSHEKEIKEQYRKYQDDYKRLESFKKKYGIEDLS